MMNFNDELYNYFITHEEKQTHPNDVIFSIDKELEELLDEYLEYLI